MTGIDEPFAQSFESKVLEDLATIKAKIETLPDLQKRVSALESHRNWLAGVVAAVSALGGYVHFRPH